MEPKEQLKESNTIIKMEHVRKTYQMGTEEIQALDDISFTIQKGEFVSIIGPSGSGKSTLMNMLGLLDVPDSGKYFLKDIEMQTLSDNQLAEIRNKKIGFIFQSFNLLGKLNAAENIKIPLMYSGKRAKELNAIVSTYLEKVGLKGREKHLPSQLSGGQQQRVAIARALVCNPEIILADEPTGALDSKTGMEIMEILKELNEKGQTIILITHDASIAAQAKRMVRIADGKMYEEREAI